MRTRERLAWSLVGLLVSTMLLGGGYHATNLQNGDVNGAGAIDVADPVYLLAFLFNGGPEPARIHGLVPESGQESCYGTLVGSAAVPCDVLGIPAGQDAAIASGAPLAGRFLANGDGTVTDQATGLTWAAVMTQTATWETGLQSCADLVLGGNADWRLPSIHELQSVVLLGTHWIANPLMGNDARYTWYDPSFFSLSPQLGLSVWSSTTSTAFEVTGTTAVQMTGRAYCLRISGPTMGSNFVVFPVTENNSKVGGQSASVWAVRGP